MTGPSIDVAMSPANPVAGAKVGSLWSGKRLYVALLLFLNLFINYMHRFNLSVAAPAIAKDFGWDAGKMGLLFSSYQWTYCLFLLVWGALSDRIGTRWVNGLSVTVWSIAGMPPVSPQPLAACWRLDWRWALERRLVSDLRQSRAPVVSRQRTRSRNCHLQRRNLCRPRVFCALSGVVTAQARLAHVVHDHRITWLLLGNSLAHIFSRPVCLFLVIGGRTELHRRSNRCPGKNSAQPARCCA